MEGWSGVRGVQLRGVLSKRRTGPRRAWGEGTGKRRDDKLAARDRERWPKDSPRMRIMLVKLDLIGSDVVGPLVE